MMNDGQDIDNMNSSDHSPIVHQLPEYARHRHPPTYEYPLPAQLDEPTLATLDPWIRQIAGLSPANAHAALAARWDGLRDDALCRLRDHLLEGDVPSIALAGDRAWVVCVRENGGFNLVAPPLDRHAIKTQQAAWKGDENPLLADLLEHFGGLREDFAPGGGCFIDQERWEFVDQPWMFEKVKGCSDWKDSLFLFSSRGGDGLLLHPSGKVGWWVADEVQVRDAYNGLASCVVDFIRYRQVPWPFDPYEPRPEFWRVVG
jgi:hypothetical protein